MLLERFTQLTDAHPDMIFLTGKSYKITFQELSLTESNLSIRLNNDLDSAVIEVQTSFVNNEPVVFLTEYVLERRELMIIQSSNVNTAFLEKNLWTPLFQVLNIYEN